MAVSEAALLLDPTIDLNWSRFQGAVQDIFSKNAEDHPKRDFVIETMSNVSAEQRFTYAQIHEALEVDGAVDTA